MSSTPPSAVSQRICLHVGCGPADPERLHPAFRGPEWREVRLDIDPRVAPDILASIVDMSAVPSGSADAVWSSHNLEHLFSHEVGRALSEFLRVLKPGGTALVSLPDLQRVAELVAAGRLEDVAYESPAGPISPLDMIYGHRRSIAAGNHFMAHRTGFTAGTLAAALERAGFINVRVAREEFNLWAAGERPPATA